jgi:hypothetical protein
MADKLTYILILVNSFILVLLQAQSICHFLHNFIFRIPAMNSCKWPKMDDVNQEVKNVYRVILCLSKGRPSFLSSDKLSKSEEN